MHSRVAGILERLGPSRSNVLLSSWALLILLSCCRANDLPTSSELSLSFDVTDNYDADRGGGSGVLRISNHAERALPQEGWALYFNSIRRLTVGDAPGLSLEWINGDFYRIEPTESFEGLAAGATVAIELLAGGPYINESDAPRGAYFVFDGRPAPDSSISVDWIMGRDEDRVRFDGDLVAVPTAASRFAENQSLSLLPRDSLSSVIPTPFRARSLQGSVTLDSTSVIGYGDGLESEAEQLALFEKERR